MATKKEVELVTIKPIEWAYVPVRIVGDTPLIEHAWSEKAKRMMLEAQQGIKLKKKEIRDPVAEFIDSMYWLDGAPEEKTEEGFEKAIANGARFGFPVTGLKQASISAAYRMGWVKDKACLKGTFFIDGEFIEIKSSKAKMEKDIEDEQHKITPVIREDMVRIGMGTADLRYRGIFYDWYADVVVKYNRNGLFSFSDIVNIINAGGAVCGLGEWRVERDGQFGMYHVETAF